MLGRRGKGTGERASEQMSERRNEGESDESREGRRSKAKRLSLARAVAYDVRMSGIKRKKRVNGSRRNF